MPEKKKKGKSTMLMPTIIMAVLAITMLIIGYYRGEGQHIAGTKAGMKMLLEITPLLLFALIMAGMIQVLLPQELVSKWIGKESGFRGILIGTLGGALTPGGPFVSMPIVAGLWKSGASAGTLVAFLTSWSLLAVTRIPLEVGILGWKFMGIRMACTFFVPPMAGLLAQAFFADKM